MVMTNDKKKRVATNLKDYIVKETIRREEATGKKVKVKDIILELTNYCDLDMDPSRHIEIVEELTNPTSMYVGLRVAEYFNVPIGDMYKLEEHHTGE